MHIFLKKVWFMVFNATFKNISFISWRSVLLVEETWVLKRKSPTCRKSLTNFYHIMFIEYTSPWTGFELTTLVVMGTDCTSSCKSNYHTIMTMTSPFQWNNPYIIITFVHSIINNTTHLRGKPFTDCIILLKYCTCAPFY